MKNLFKPWLVAALVLVASPASALLIEISENEDFTGSVLSLGDTDGDGSVALIGALGNWTTNLSGGASSTALPGNARPQLHLHSFNISGVAGGTLYIRLTDSGFSLSDPNYQFVTQFGGVTAGTVQFRSYLNDTLLSDSGTVGSGPFSAFGSGRGVASSQDFSLTILATITHQGSGMTSFNYEVKVPEPGTLGLLGLGLLGIGLSRRRTTT